VTALSSKHLFFTEKTLAHAGKSVTMHTGLRVPKPLFPCAPDGLFICLFL